MNTVSKVTEVEKVKELVKANGGATLDSNLKSIQAQKGYMVSLKGYEFITKLEALNSFILEEYKLLASQLNGYIGLWLDGEDLYIDISQHHTDKQKAIQLGTEHKQLAIYSIKDSTEIRLNK